MDGGQLAELCRNYGTVTNAWIVRDPETGAPWRFGFVEFASPAEASFAAGRLHGTRYRGDVLAARQVDSVPSDPERRSLPRAPRRRPATEAGKAIRDEKPADPPAPDAPVGGPDQT